MSRQLTITSTCRHGSHPDAECLSMSIRQAGGGRGQNLSRCLCCGCEINLWGTGLGIPLLHRLPPRGCGMTDLDQVKIPEHMIDALVMVARIEHVTPQRLVEDMLGEALGGYLRAALQVADAIEDALDFVPGTTTDDDPEDHTCQNNSRTPSQQSNGDGKRPTGSADTGTPSTTSSKPSTTERTGGTSTTSGNTSNTESSPQPDGSSTPDPDPEPDLDSDEWPCPHCDRTFDSPQGLNGHQSVHQDTGTSNGAALDAMEDLADAGWVHQDVADLFDISRTAVAQWVTRRHVPAGRRAALVDAAADLDQPEGDIPANDIQADVTPDPDPCDASGCDDPPTVDDHGLCGRHARLMSSLATGMRDDLDKTVARRVALDGLIEHGDNVTVLGARGLLQRHADNNDNGDGRDREACRAAGCDDAARGGWCNRHRHAVRTLADTIRPEVGHIATKQAAAAFIEHGDDANYDLAIAGAA